MVEPLLIELTRYFNSYGLQYDGVPILKKILYVQSKAACLYHKKFSKWFVRSRFCGNQDK